MIPDGKIQEAIATGDLDRAVTNVLQTYGPELLGFLAALRERHEAEDIFAMVSEDLWRGLPMFRWEASLRTWLYRLTRNAMSRYERRAQVRAEQQHHVNRAVNDERRRVTTAPYLRTTMKDAVRSLRERLTPEDRMILILRVDRNLAWRDVHHVLYGETAATQGEVTRGTARLRKRFERIKDELRRLSVEAGLIAR